MLTVKYFASVREALGIEGEQRPVPEPEPSVAALLADLRSRHQPLEDLLKGDQVLLVAVNQTVSSYQQLLQDGDEVAFFPPMTGG